MEMVINILFHLKSRLLGKISSGEGAFFGRYQDLEIGDEKEYQVVGNYIHPCTPYLPRYRGGYSLITHRQRSSRKSGRLKSGPVYPKI